MSTNIPAETIGEGFAFFRWTAITVGCADDTVELPGFSKCPGWGCVLCREDWIEMQEAGRG